jgi:hypothetical protein
MINWANWLVHKVCDGRQTPKSIIGNIETISLSLGIFPDVFLEELPGMPPNSEVEFVIDLVGTQKLGYPSLLCKDAVPTRLSLVAW